MYESHFTSDGKVHVFAQSRTPAKSVSLAMNLIILASVFLSSLVLIKGEGISKIYTLLD